MLAVKVENTGRGLSARRARARGRDLRGARRGQHHPVRRALPVPRRRASGTRPERSDDRPEDPRAVLGRAAPRVLRSQPPGRRRPGRGGRRLPHRDDRERGVRAGRIAVRAAQPLRLDEEALPAREAGPKVDFALPEAVFRFDEEVPSPSKRRTSASVAFAPTRTSWGGPGPSDRWVRQLDGEPMLAENGDTDRRGQRRDPGGRGHRFQHPGRGGIPVAGGEAHRARVARGSCATVASSPAVGGAARSATSRSSRPRRGDEIALRPARPSSSWCRRTTARSPSSGSDRRFPAGHGGTLGTSALTRGSALTRRTPRERADREGECSARPAPSP